MLKKMALGEGLFPSFRQRSPSATLLPSAFCLLPSAFLQHTTLESRMEFAIFFFFAAVAVIFAVLVIAHRNPVVGALSLVASFFALAVMYVLLDAPFLAALQVIVYAGAIMVLFLLDRKS